MTKNDEAKLPLYLGFCNKENAYYFYGQKEGEGRFLKYITYFYWASNPPAILNTRKELPDSVNLELSEFLSGKIGYEFIKRRRNSKTVTVAKYYKSPPTIEVVSSEDPKVHNGQGEVERGESSSSDVRRGGIRGRRKRSDTRSESNFQAGNVGTENSKPRRRSRKPDGNVHALQPIADLVTVAQVVQAVVKKRQKKEKVMEVPVVVQEPEKSQGRKSSATKQAVPHENLETPKKRTRRTAIKNADIELTPVEEAPILQKSNDSQLGSLVVKKKRGRPRKVEA